MSAFFPTVKSVEVWIHSSVCGVITIYLTLDIFTSILTGNPSAVRVADDFKSWAGNIAASVTCSTHHQPTFQGKVVRGVFEDLQGSDRSKIIGKLSEYSTWASSCATHGFYAGSLMDITGTSSKMTVTFYNVGPFGGYPNNSWTLIETCQLNSLKLVSWTHWNFMSPLIYVTLKKRVHNTIRAQIVLLTLVITSSTLDSRSTIFLSSSNT